jgi:hypothetical protein
MKYLLPYVLIAASMLAFAQQPPSGAEEAKPAVEKPATEQPADPCRDIEDAPQEGSPAPGSGIKPEAGTEQPPEGCKDKEDEAPEVAAGVQATEPPEPPAETGDSDPDDEDFTPGEEISKDYPVPLPSDI